MVYFHTWKICLGCVLKVLFTRVISSLKYKCPPSLSPWQELEAFQYPLYDVERYRPFLQMAVVARVAKTSEHRTAVNWLFDRRLQRSPIFYQVIIRPISQIWVLFSLKIVKISQLGGKTLKLLTSACSGKSLLIALQDVLLIPEIDEKNVLGHWKGSKTLWITEIGEFKEKKSCRRQVKSSPILGYPPNSFLTLGRPFQSSPIRRVNCSVGNTGTVPGSGLVK